MEKSVLTDDMDHCVICLKPNPHIHHIFEGYGRRRKSGARGFVIPLCPNHHNMSNKGIHFNKDVDLFFKRMAQNYYETYYGTRKEFIEEFGRNYILED